jgi:hypothetical protein|uniref:Uncharacterized protein n=1 Tax=Baffinella frigidus TaxID=2571260 RepID=A0A7T8JK71_9CRYP|nr:hypothetical protein [Cryptophyta sp. CCMP2293]
MNNNLPNLPDLYSHFVKYDETKENPKSAFEKMLNSGKGLKVNMPSMEDKDFYESNDIQKPGVIAVTFQNPNPVANFKPTKSPTFGYTRSPSYPLKEDKAILNKLNQIPVFCVVTGQGEIVVSSPRSVKPLNFFTWVYEKYFNNFIWMKDDGPVNLALYFMHKEDAELYLHEICVQDPKGVQRYGIEVQASGLDNYYHLNKTAPPKTQVKLVADLKEVDLVIKKYAKDKSFSKHPKQQYTSTSFKGTPIYLLPDAETNLKIVFFKKEDASAYWKEIRKWGQSKKPPLEIYNLESYLSDIQELGVDYITEIPFISSSESILALKKLHTQEPARSQTNDSFNQRIKESLKPKIISLQRFCKGMIWLITSETLPTEENSW